MRWLVVVIALVGGAAAADEGDREIARKRYEMGIMLYGRGRYAEALVELEAAKQAFDRPEFDYNIGLCLAKLDHPSEAADALERFVRARPNDPEAPGIRARIAELRQEQPKPPPPPSPPSPLEHPPLPAVPPPAPPQAHAPPPEPVAPPPPRPFWKTDRGVATLVLGGVAVGSVIAAAALGGVALSRRSAYDDGCTLGHCDRTLYDEAHQLAIGCDVLLGVSVGAAAIATIVLFTRPKEKPIAVAPLVSPHAGGLTLGGAF
jgi:hypothetical protein